jgi:hypothetical protein
MLDLALTLALKHALEECRLVSRKYRANIQHLEYYNLRNTYYNRGHQFMYCRRDLEIAIQFTSDLAFKNLLYELRELLPKIPISKSLTSKSSDNNTLEEWLEKDSKDWLERFREILNKRRDICYSWSFTYQQVKLVNQYYNANKFLMNCLNKASGLSKSAKKEIEETLLLQIAEIEKCKRGKSGTERSHLKDV